MDSSLDLSRWREAPRGVAYRRWAMVSTGLRHLLRTRFFRAVVSVAWLGGALIAVAGFVFSQALASGGWLEALAQRAGPRFEAQFTMINALVAMFPDIVVHGIFTAIFWAHSFLGLWLSLLSLTLIVPSLITNDRASNALIVYLSRPLTSIDYLLGKLGIIVGTLLLVWTGPLLFGWLLSMLFATDVDFVHYSLVPLLRALLFNGICLVTLAAIALGVSALGRNSRITMITWIGLWLIFAFLALNPRAPDFIRRASFTNDLNQVRQSVFKLDTALADASAKLPILNQRTVANLTTASQQVEASDFNGALVSLGIFVIVSSFVFFRRLRPE
jgi:ABC-2 family transporter